MNDVRAANAPAWWGKTRWKASILLTAAGLVLVAGLKIFAPFYRTTTAAMAPTILVGDGVFVNRRAYRSATPVRGDVIAFRRADNTFVFRIVALPGEVVEVRSKQLFINDVPAVEPFAVNRDSRVFPRLRELPEPYRSRDHFGPLTVPAGHYFVMGDNRDAATDSRFLGPVSRDHIVGRLLHIVRTGRELEEN